MSNLCLILSMYCFPDGEFLKRINNILNGSRQNSAYTMTEVVDFFVEVRLQLVIINKSLNRKIYRSFFNPDGN